MSYKDKIEAARSLLEQHNSGITDVKHQFDIEKFFSKLIAVGGTTDEALSECKWEDLETCGLPRLLCRKVAEIFRGTDDKKKRLVSVKESQAKALPVAELIEYYDPKESDNAVAKVLEEKSKGKQFIVFNDDGSVNIEASLMLLNEIREGHSPRDFYSINGIPRQVYVVGGRPDKLADINPLFPSEVLRPDGTCSQTGRSWQSAEKETKQIVFLARTYSKEISIDKLSNAHDIMDIAVSDNGLDRIRQRCPKAAIRLAELKAQDSEPSLRKPIGQATGSKSNDPFHQSTSSHIRY